MKELRVSDNYNDLCVETGVNAGFQFEFFCERCSETWRTEFVPFRSGQATGWLQKASGVFGGLLGGAADAVDGLARSGFGKARDEAFQAAIEQATHHFHRCARCYQYVCDVCWNGDAGLCLNCAPDVQTEVEAARIQGENLRRDGGGGQSGCGKRQEEGRRDRTSAEMSAMRRRDEGGEILPRVRVQTGAEEHLSGLFRRDLSIGEVLPRVRTEDR
jgi:hypothetical protein